MSAHPMRRRLAAVAIGAALWFVGAGLAPAAEERLYPSGPPHGVGYLRFANLTAQDLTIVSASARITLPADDGQQVRRWDPVTPGSELTGVAQQAGKTAPIKVALAPNEFVTVAVLPSRDGGLATMLFREMPSDFNASRSSLSLYNADDGCADARLLAGDPNTVAISGVAPGAAGRRMVNPVDVTLTVACSESPKPLAANLGALAAGERYSIFVFALPGAGARIVALRDETAPFRP